MIRGSNMLPEFVTKTSNQFCPLFLEAEAAASAEHLEAGPSDGGENGCTWISQEVSVCPWEDE